MKTYTPEQSARILDACQSIMLGNNGYADIGAADWLADAVRDAGFVVIRSTNLHGAPTWKGYTKAAQDALRAAAASGEVCAVSSYKPARLLQDGPDMEAAILARQESQMMDY